MLKSINDKINRANNKIKEIVKTIFFLSPYTLNAKIMQKNDTHPPPKYTQFIFLREFFGKLIQIDTFLYILEGIS